MKGKRLVAPFLAVVVLCAGQAAFAGEVPSGWIVRDRLLADQLITLMKTKEQALREKNLKRCLGMMPEYLSVSLMDQAKAMGWNDQKTAVMLQRGAMSAKELKTLPLIGMKRKDLTAALLFKKQEAGEAIYLVQSFHLVGSAWKIGERMKFPQRDARALSKELEKVVFHKKLPAVANRPETKKR